MMKLFSLDDFKDTKIDPNWGPFDYLLQVTDVDQQKLEKSMNCKLKPRVRIIFKRANMGFKFNNSDVIHKPKRSKKESPVCPIPPPDLPENIKQHIVEKMGGSGLVLVIQKPLFFSDVNPSASRFSIPFSQVITHDFLNETEAYNLDHKNAMQVCLLDPSMKETTQTFNKWIMGKTPVYVMTNAWNPVVKNNRLKENDIVQLWSFRVDSKLCFALVKV